MKTLQIIRTACCATIEEQDDAVAWITRATRAPALLGRYDRVWQW